MLTYLRQVKNRDEGATAVEYGLMVAAIAAVIVLVVFALGGVVHKKFQDTCTNISKGGGGTLSAGCAN